MATRAPQRRCTGRPGRLDDAGAGRTGPVPRGRVEADDGAIAARRWRRCRAYKENNRMRTTAAAATSQTTGSRCQRFAALRLVTTSRHSDARCRSRSGRRVLRRGSRFAAADPCRPASANRRCGCFQPDLVALPASRRLPKEPTLRTLGSAGRRSVRIRWAFRWKPLWRDSARGRLAPASHAFRPQCMIGHARRNHNRCRSQGDCPVDRCDGRHPRRAQRTRVGIAWLGGNRRRNLRAGRSGRVARRVAS
jgi:hypothetical protein